MRARVLLPCAVVLFTATFAGGNDDPEPPNDVLKRLQGEWKLVSREIRGKKSPQTLVANSRLVIKGNEWTLTLGMGGPTPETMKIDASKRPMKIDLTTKVEKGGQARPSKGIFEIKGDTLTICRVITDAEGARPKKFETTARSGILLVFERVKK